MGLNLAADDFYAIAGVPRRRTSFAHDATRTIVQAHRDFVSRGGFHAFLDLVAGHCPTHRTDGGRLPDLLANATDQAKVVAFLEHPADGALRIIRK